MNIIIRLNNYFILQYLAVGMEMEAALAAADAFRIDDASCAVTQFCPNIHETGFLHEHTHNYVVMAV